jgi:hypothetical protein
MLIDFNKDRSLILILSEYPAVYLVREYLVEGENREKIGTFT